MATGGSFVKIMFFVDNSCQALPADQMVSFGMTAWFVSFLQKKQHLRTHQIYLKMQNNCDFIIFFLFIKSNNLDTTSHLSGTA